MLTDIKRYLSNRNGATLTEIAVHFASEPDALRPMLDQWIRKGKVRRIAGPRCQGCCACDETDVEFYEWIARPTTAERVPAVGGD